MPLRGAEVENQIPPLALAQLIKPLLDDYRVPIADQR
jgi:hypothetical protein